MAKISTDAEINSLRLKEQASAPGTPASGYFQVYVKTDGKLYYKDDAGTEVCLTDKMTNPMTTAGDIIFGGASGAPTRLGAGTEDYVLTMGASNPEWAVGGGVSLVSASYTRTAGSYSTTSTTFVDVDATNMALALTTGARRVMITFLATISMNVAPHTLDFDVYIDSARVSGQDHGIFRKNIANTNWDVISFTWITDALSAGAHTFKLQWKVSGGTGSIYGAGAAWPARFAVVELL